MVYARGDGMEVPRCYHGLGVFVTRCDSSFCEQPGAKTVFMTSRRNSDEFSKNSNHLPPFPSEPQVQ